jgi:hypothetical protein
MCKDNPLAELQKQIPMIPLDGVAVVATVYMLSPKEKKLQNSLIVGGIHYFIHEMICCDC